MAKKKSGKKKKKLSSQSGPSAVHTQLAKHFGSIALTDLVTSIRLFPVTALLDVHGALAEVLRQHIDELQDPIGLFQEYGRETISFAELMPRQHSSVLVAPLQYEEIDAGELAPARCLKRALWLGRAKGVPCAVLLDRTFRHSTPTGLAIEIALPKGHAGADLTERIMDTLQRRVAEARSYRGKVLSLEGSGYFDGTASQVRVHRLPVVPRENVILPDKTLTLLERNLTRFIQHRDQLSALDLGIKKGLLFYGPPGTGKTHTIRYLAGQLPAHTTLLITAQEIALLDEYIKLARFLQPAMVVIEDVDLIARGRRSTRSSREESLLNSLLNEMDGLREDASVLFILTTNHPEELEAALTSRPGRIDQAIEFPLPDEKGRARLITLYGGKLQPPPKVVDLLVRKTKGASGAFIRELMRRSAQFMLEDKSAELKAPHIESALDEMLFSGGKLNAKLLGMTREK